MKKLILIITCALIVFSCGYDFYMNRRPVQQTVFITHGEHTLNLAASTAEGDDFFRSHLESDFFRGYADIIYENGTFKINYRNLPISEENMEKVKDDLYAMYFAGDYPYKSSYKKFGKTQMENGTKLVYDTDGYLLYKVHYGASQISLYNIVGDYSIVIDYMSGSRQN